MSDDLPPGHTAAERLASRPVFSGRVIDVSVDRVRLPNGRESDLELVHFHGAAAVVPLLDGADGPEVVMVRQYRYATGGWLLEIPAGKLDGDEGPARCARRELAEETGYAAAELEELGWIWSTPGATDEKIWLFAARGLTAGEAALEDDEVLQLVRLPLAEAVRRATAGEIHDAKTVCALLRLAARG
jgi:ADP-ribose pyrophosphatase